MKKEIDIEGVFNRWINREPTEGELRFIFPHNKTPERVLQRIKRGERFLTAIEIHKICDLLKVTPDMLEMEVDASVSFKNREMKLTFDAYGNHYSVVGELESNGLDFVKKYSAAGELRQLRVLKNQNVLGGFDLSLNKALGSFVFNVVKEIKNLEATKNR